MPGTFHLPTAVVVAGAFVLLGVLVGLWRRQRARGFLSEVDRATYETLTTASRASRHLRSGLSAEGAEKAARDLRSMLGASAVAVCDTGAVLAWEGTGGHHAAQAIALAQGARASGHIEVVPREGITCADPDCPVRGAVIAPLVADDRVVGTLTAYTLRPSAGLARATEQVAAWVSAQVELSELDRERTRAVEAELRSLRAQISPHFIYNSLAAIASFVRTDPDRARELLLEFADFTRYALRRGGAFTTLSEELRNVERYLVLEEARFGERLQVSLLIAPEVLALAVPYLVVQPLVENAVRHGLAGKEGVGHVSITASDQGSEAEITVEDDGVGADPEVIRQVLDGVRESDSIGLGNVDARLRQVYDDDHGLVVETAPGLGTKVSFRIPKYAPGVHPSA